MILGLEAKSDTALPENQPRIQLTHPRCGRCSVRPGRSHIQNPRPAGQARRGFELVGLAERGGFEPPVRFPLQLLSRQPCSATPAPLHICFTLRGPVAPRPLPRSRVKAGGGSRIRTHGTCVQRFSRPPPSTTRPSLRVTPQNVVSLGKEVRLVKDFRFRERGGPSRPCMAATLREFAHCRRPVGTARAAPPWYGPLPGPIR